MKKPLSHYKVLIIQHNAEKRRKRVKNKKKPVYKDDESKNKVTSVNHNPRNGKEIIELPERFNLEDNFEVVIDRIDKVAKCIKAGIPIYVDFDKVRNISVSATLMLAAELDIYNLVKRGGGRLHAYDSKWDKNVRNRLKEMGFLKLLKVKSEMERTYKNENEKEIFIKFISGNKHYEDASSVAKFIVEVNNTLNKRKIPEELSLHLHAGMSEAINNTVEHAYEEKQPDRQNRWWVSASINRDNQEIKVICYDRGLTISKTIRESETKLNQIKMLIGNKDHEIIMAALEHKHSSTKRANRGNGLSSLIGFIEENGQGVMKVYSGEGMIQYDKSQKHDNEGYNSNMLGSKIRGTLIEWSVILNNNNIEANYDNTTEDSGRVFASADGQGKR